MMGFSFGGFLLMILFWIILIALGIWLVKILFFNEEAQTKNKPPHQLNAREILDQRYAKGEISREQYEIMKRDLEGNTLSKYG